MNAAARWATGAVCAGAVLVGSLGALVAGAVWCGAGVALVHLPRPTGAYAVGTSVVTLPSGVPAQFWYPAAPVGAVRRAPYRWGVPPRRLRDRLAAAFVGTNAAVDVPVAAGMHAVVLYVPSWGGVRSDNTAQAENLASHGFMVVAIDDLFPAQAMDLSSEVAYERTLRWADVKARLQAKAVSDVLAALSAPQFAVHESRLAGHLDPQRIGMFGFSFGGAVAAEAATLDPRIRAAANLDGWVFSDAAQRGVPRPFLMVSSAAQDNIAAQAADPSDHRFSDLLDRANLKAVMDGLERYGGYFLTVSGTDHYNFSDVAVLPSLRRRGVGPIDGRRGQAIVAEYLVQFFDRFLRDRPAPLLEAVAKSRSHDRSRTTLDPAAQLEIWHSAQVGIKRTPNRSRERGEFRSGVAA